MKGYAELHVFTERELALRDAAERLVRCVDYIEPGSEEEPVRCHELARAVGEILELEVQDGRFGFVEHSWLWTSKYDPSGSPWVLPNVLDVYTPGRVPQVHLVHTASGLPACYFLVSNNDLVVRQDVVTALIDRMIGAI